MAFLRTHDLYVSPCFSYEHCVAEILRFECFLSPRFALCHLNRDLHLQATTPDFETLDVDSSLHRDIGLAALQLRSCSSLSFDYQGS